MIGFSRLLVQSCISFNPLNLDLDNLYSSIEYNNSGIDAVYLAQGRYIWSSSCYEYTLTDHLGNARIQFSDKDNNGIITPATELIQANHYYPFGLNHIGPWTGGSAGSNKYQYNGKELNEDFGLSLNDYGARWYDAAIGRWASVDPLTEKMMKWSPYNYGFDNPIRFLDPNGMESEAFRNGLVGLAAEQKEQSEAEREVKNRVNAVKSWINQLIQNPTATLTITNKEVGTANVVDNYFEPDKTSEGYNNLYYNVPTYEMSLEGTSENGTYIYETYEVIRYGVKRKSYNGTPFYQGFGATNYASEDMNYTLGAFAKKIGEDNYGNAGGFNINGAYNLHGGPLDPTAIPQKNTDTSGRRNYGCIAVCGYTGYSDLKEKLRTIYGSSSNYNLPINVINVIIQPLTPPQGKASGTHVK